MKKITCIVLAMVLGGATLVAAAEEKPNMMVTTGGIGGVYYYYGTTVAEILTKNAGMEATAIQTAASVDNLLLIQRRTNPAKNTYYLGTVLPDSAYLAYSGKLDRFKDKPAKEIRIMWAMYPNLLHVVTVSGSGIKTVADLKGKRVSTGAPGSGTEVEAFMVLDAAGLKTSDLGKQERLGAAESSEALSQGTLEAYFWSGGLPTASVTELATSLARKGSKIEFVDMAPNGDLVKKLLQEYPGVMETGVIPKEVYRTDKDNQTLAFWNLFVGPKELPEKYSYSITKTVFEHLAQLQAAVKAAQDTTPANAVKFIKGVIPYDSGSLRYFKETGALK
ncbi:MAG TPA: TAXI family TRAP transporter solute-binding subunit [Thermodesulfobacteriota bacterium]|nr:TAXI family TRAP transporter solute-binding subunit [Thermodesulfobacteriota bacterium]